MPDVTRVMPAIQQAAAELAPEDADLIRDVAPVYHGGDPDHEAGALRASIEGRSEPTGEGATITVTSDVPYEPYVRLGTGPHEIFPVQGTVLRWYTAGGAVVFARHVDHPGTAPNDYPKIAEPRIFTLAHEHMAVRVREALLGRA